MLTDKKKFEKWYLLNGMTFDRIKTMQDAETNFTVLDKSLKNILYNRKMSTHDKFVRYTQLFEKYLKLRKELRTNTSINPSGTIEKTNKSESNRKEDFNSSSEDSELEEEVGDDYEEENNKTLDFSSMIESDGKDSINETLIQPSNEEYFENDDEEISNSRPGMFVKNPNVSVKSAARELFENDEEHEHIQPDKDQLISHNWRGKKYTLKSSMLKKFIEFTKRVEVAYPGVTKVELSDFTDYLVNRRVNIKHPIFDTRRQAPSVSNRKKAKVFSNMKTPKRTKDILIDDFFRKTKRAKSHDKSRIQTDQSGEGLKKIKWFSFK